MKMTNSPKIYRTLRPAAMFLFKILFHPKIKGAENIPEEGRVVLAGNHILGLDCFPVIAGTKRCIHFLAKKEIFANRFLRWFFNSAGLIPVDRQNGDKDALRKAKQYLENDAVVALFPEGTAIKDVPLLPFKMGAVKMASDTHSPICPFVINGTYRFIKCDVEIEFLEPYYIESDDLVAENDKLREIIRSKLR